MTGARMPRVLWAVVFLNVSIQCGNPRNPSNESSRRDWSPGTGLPLPTFRDMRLQSLALCSGQG